MGTKGQFGFIFGKKKRMMHVECDADQLWSILVREMYIVLKHYETIEMVKKAFEKIKIPTTPPTQKQIEKCKCFSDATFDINNTNSIKNDSINGWYFLLKKCQCSFINILHCGYMLNNASNYGYTFLLDFNTNAIHFTFTEYNNREKKLNSMPLENIIIENAPLKTYNQIIEELKINYEENTKKKQHLSEEIIKIKTVIQEAKKQNSINIEDKANSLLDNTEWELKKLIMYNNDFNYRLKQLGLTEIEEI
jgi:hypothetical protein